MKKFILTVLILASALFIMSGCVEITYGFYVNANGSVEKKYQAVVDPEGDFGIYNADYALEIATAQLEGMLEQEPENGEIVVNEENPYDVSLVYKYEALTEYYIAMGITGDEEPEADDTVTEMDLIYRYDTFTVFDGYDNAYGEDWAESFREDIFSAFPEIPYNDINVKLEYGTKYTKMYTSNSDSVYDKDGSKVYVWECKLDELDEARLMTARQANYTSWYLIAISASIIISVILYIAVKLKSGGKDGKQASIQ
jgi:hypothetical protein